MKNLKIILIAFLFCAYNGHSQTQELADEYWDKAIKAQAIEDWGNAAILFEKSAEAEKKSPNPRLNELSLKLNEASLNYNKIGNYDKALTSNRSPRKCREEFR